MCETNIMVKHINTENCSDFAVTGFIHSSQSVHEASIPTYHLEGDKRDGRILITQKSQGSPSPQGCHACKM